MMMTVCHTDSELSKNVIVMKNNLCCLKYHYASL